MSFQSGSRADFEDTGFSNGGFLHGQDTGLHISDEWCEDFSYSIISLFVDPKIVGGEGGVSLIIRLSSEFSISSRSKAHFLEIIRILESGRER